MYLYEDSEGNLYSQEQVDEMTPWDIQEKGIHLSDFYWE